LERRKSHRLGTSLELDYSDGQGFLTGLILDFSSGGLQVEVTKVWEIGTILILSLPFKPALKLKGIVRWAKKKGLKYRIGIQFLDLTPNQESIVRAINQSLLWKAFKR